jgi:hypothetical protein
LIDASTDVVCDRAITVAVRFGDVASRTETVRIPIVAAAGRARVRRARRLAGSGPSFEK